MIIPRLLIRLALSACIAFPSAAALAADSEDEGERASAERQTGADRQAAAETPPEKSPAVKAIEEAERDKERARERARARRGAQAKESPGAAGEAGTAESLTSAPPESGTVAAVSAPAPSRAASPEWPLTGDTVATPNGVWVLSANPVEDAVLVLGARTDELVTRIPVAGGPVDIAISPDGRRAFVACWRNSTIAEISLSDFKVSAVLRGGNRPTSIAVSPSGRELYSANYSDNSVTVFEIPSRRRLCDIPVGTLPTSVTVSTDGKRIYVLNSGDGSVSVIDARSRKPVATVRSR